MPRETTAADDDTGEVDHIADIEFAVHDGVGLIGDFWGPKHRADAPLIVAVHGGAWQIGARSRYVHWGPYLAKRGYCVFAVDYRLSTPTTPSFPQAVYDVKAAVQFARGRAADFGVDPTRIAMMGDSAGAHLASVAALAWNEPIFSTNYKDDAHAGVPADVKAVIGFYGVYDLLAQWEHDQVTRSGDLTIVKFLGFPPRDNRRVYFDASPINYTTTDRNKTRFLLIDGTTDNIINTKRQAEAFLTALKHANFFARDIVVPAAGHFWIVEPLDEPGSYCAAVAPRLLRFLETSL